MWTHELTARQKSIGLLAFMTLLVVIVCVGLLLQEYGPGNMGYGLLSGAAFGLVVAAVGLWRASRHSDRATTFERAFTQTGDERDDALLTQALAVLGICAVPLTGVATIAIGFGADVEMVLFFLLVSQVAVGTVAFAIQARRH